ncbi:MAG TPA: FAD-dependent monooxygenase, partial [Chloroflexia bacterium]|nr:FAD-dependent monooxygenase [Chloroflexia bacterium]
DGVNSITRKLYEEQFKPSVEWGKAKYIWLGADKVLDAFNFIFHENEHGLFQVHAYPFSGTTSTFIVECDEESWLNAGLDRASEAESLDYCRTVLSRHLGGADLISNNSKWLSFPTLKTKRWHTGAEAGSVVLLGDAAHTAHFSIGAGTKLAMEDAIALASAFDTHADTEAALNAYELERKPVVETFQRAAAESQAYFETTRRYLGLPPMQFAFQLLTRSGRITYDDLHFRDSRFGDQVDRLAVRSEATRLGAPGVQLAPPPLFAPLRLRDVALPNRAVVALPADYPVPTPAAEKDVHLTVGAGLVMTGICAVSEEGRITPESPGLYAQEQQAHWLAFVSAVHKAGGKAGIQIGHAGRRGSVRPRREGLDRALKVGGWPLMSASALPYSTGSQVPREMDRSDMEHVRESFVQAARMADSAGFDLLQIHMAHGYLLASFLSPLTNLRGDEYGGSLEARSRYPLEVFSAVREIWPAEKPLSVALSASDYARGGAGIDDAVAFARLLKANGCDLVEVLAGQTTPQSEPPYSKGFLTPLSERLRNAVGIATMVGGYLTTSNEANTILAAGRADLCVIAIS